MGKDEDFGSSKLGLHPIKTHKGAAEDEWKTMHSAKCKISPRIAQIRLVASHPEVYEPCDDSFALVDALLADRANMVEHQPKICLEIGSGSGYVITSLAVMLGQDLMDTSYFATDINPFAVETTVKTLRSHGVHAEVVCTDLASGLLKRLTHQVDVVVVNPPYVPTPEDEVGREGITAAWAGGENGRTVIDRILPVVDQLLSSKGWFFMLTLAANKPAQICHLMKEKGYLSRIVVQRSTEEESLHVIKFWRNFEDGHDSGRATTPRSGGSESWFSQKFRKLSFRGKHNSDG